MKKLLIKIKEVFRKNEIKEKLEQLRKEKFLHMYYSYLYQKNDINRVTIPHFEKAEQTVEDLKYRGLINDVYEYILEKGVA